MTIFLKLFGRLYGLGSALANYEDEVEFLPQPAWTPLGKQKAAVNSALANIWSSQSAFLNFQSSVTCIKRLGHNFHDAASTNSSVQRALYPQFVASIMHMYMYIVVVIVTRFSNFACFCSVLLQYYLVI
jgi:hypothetical protein